MALPDGREAHIDRETGEILWLSAEREWMPQDAVKILNVTDIQLLARAVEGLLEEVGHLRVAVDELRAEA